MAKKEYKELNLRQKCELIQFLETNSERQTAEAFGVSKTTVNNIKKKKREYLDRFGTEAEYMSRKKRTTEFDDINSLTLKWFTKMREINMKLTGPMLQEAAIKFARELNQPNFKASSGWLESFKMRNNISFKNLHMSNIAATQSAASTENVFGSVLEVFSKEKHESNKADYHVNEEKSLSHHEVYEMLQKITTCYATTVCPTLLVPIYQAKKIVADEILKHEIIKQEKIEEFFINN